MGCAVTDERMSDREIRDRFDSIDKRLDRTVPLDSWNLQNSHAAANLAELDRDCRERHEDAKKDIKAVNRRIDERGNNTWSRVLGVAGIAVSLLVGILAAYISSKGIK